MRELKYRLRIKDEIVGHEKWVPSVGWIYKPLDGIWSDKYIYHAHKDQFTGLCDKNKVEIYEGDILGYHFEDEPKMTILGPVKWRKEVSIWAIDIGLGLTTIEPEDLWVPDTYEIIGNVFQNKDLLEKK